MQAMFERSAKKTPLLGRRLAPLNMPGVWAYLKDGQLLLQVPLPEFREGEVEVTAAPDGLEISAWRSNPDNQPNKEGRQSYWRHLNLPKGANLAAMKQELRGGELRITVPVKTCASGKRTQVVGYRDEEFPDDWIRYRPAH